ncbi:MAG TPA: DUF2249 domain-containing protein [Balneolaceae bacterium]|nr:DUF2249 domain-containing protein [Balneolaceae bacterium]
MAETEQQLNVTKIPPHKKHSTIFETYDGLKAGEAFVIVNDHDPKPLRFQFIAEHGADNFSWEYLENGPQVWKVRIGKTA